MRWHSAVAFFFILSSQAALAQSGLLKGVVRDAGSDRPLVGAIVTLRGAGEDRTMRTDATGRWMFSNLAPGRYDMTARLLGFEPAHVAIDATAHTADVVLTLTRVATLDTLRVRAARQGVFGVVATAHTLRPLPAATISVMGLGSMRVSIDSTGHFFAPIRAPGNYVMRAKAPGFESLSISVSVQRNDGVEIAFLLDSAASGASHMLEAAYADFEERLHRRRPMSALVPRAEIMRDSGGGRLVDALRASPSFVAKTLRFAGTACVFVDGRPRPGMSMNAIDPSAVEAVETYSAAGEASGTLAHRWPKNFPCGDTGLPKTAPGKDVIAWVSIWLKH